MQRSSTAEMIFSVAELIADLSREMTLLPGTIILTGTPAGVGFTRTPPVFLKPGDELELTIDGIGTLRNPVRAA
jgi:2-keto-4-pentenoate hydratase/2-oxohepta-3-ene-1,7-dioic acid hydratase in catechol pathway